MDAKVTFAIPDVAVRCMCSEDIWRYGVCGYWAHATSGGRYRTETSMGARLLPARLTPTMIRKGLRALALMRYKRIGELLLGNYDSGTLDALVQAAVFGRLVYG